MTRIRTAATTALGLALAMALATPACRPASAQTAAPPPAAPTGSAPVIAAAPVTAEGAQAIAAALKEGIALWLVSGEPGARVDWQGDPLVIPQGDRYAASLAPFAVVAADGGRLEVGGVRLDLVPQPGGTLGVSGLLPGALTQRGPGGALLSTITVGRQQMSGVWSPAFLNFLSMDVALGEVRIDDATGDGTLTVASLSLTQDLRAEGGTLYGGPVGLALSGLSLTDGAGKELAGIGKLTVEGNAARVDMERMGAFTRMMMDAARSRRQPDDAAVLSALVGLLGGLDCRVRAAGFRAHDEETGSEIAIEHIAFTVGAADLDRPMAAFRFGAELRGLTADDLEEHADFVPRRLDVQVSMADVPTALLGTMLRHRGPGGDQVALAGLVQAGTRLVLDRLAVDLPAAAAAADGRATFAGNAALGLAGGMTVTLTGLDTAAQALRSKSGRKPDPQTQETLGAIAMLQAMGQPGRDAQGRDVRTYRIEVTAAGQLLLNGADLLPLLNLGAGGEPAPAQPEPKVKRKE